ncbi:MAG: hypothetical protein V4550_13495 [Gemmatimonadota bacterium]
MDSLRALRALRDARSVCEADHGALWSRSVCGPIALVDRQTRLVIANDTVPARSYLPYGDAFVTSAPSGVGFANTSFAWAGRQWAMIMLPLPSDRFDRIALVMHEVFHREQAALALLGGDPPNGHLDQYDGRRLLRLELNALAAALESLGRDDTMARGHTENALLFRARRRAIYPQADSVEPALEMQEGLAEYTGVRLALTATGETSSRVARRLREFQSTPTYVRSFAYATGPALGLLLDHFSPDWRSEIGRTKDLARLLSRAIQPRADADLARQTERIAVRYGGAIIDRDELARDSQRKARLAAYAARLVDGPTLTLTQSSLNRNFDPLSLFPFDDDHTIYPTGTFSSGWGTLEVTEGGAFVANDYRVVRVGAHTGTFAAANHVIRGAGWVLTLNAGWSIVADAARLGSFLVTQH